MSIPAARAGASVTGLDLTPKLLEVARRGPPRRVLEIEFVEGDAEELPFADALLRPRDVVLRRDVRAAPEVAARRAGARRAPRRADRGAAWTPEGFVGANFRTAASYMPPPPPELKPPVMWGIERPRPRTVRRQRRAAVVRARARSRSQEIDAEAWFADDERMLGPAVMAQGRARAAGPLRGPAHATCSRLYADFNEADDGSFKAAGRVPRDASPSYPA